MVYCYFVLDCVCWVGFRFGCGCSEFGVYVLPFVGGVVWLTDGGSVC